MTDSRVSRCLSCLIATCALLIVCALPHAAHANGYAIYAAPLAWSPDGRYLAACVTNEWPYTETVPQGELRLYDRYGRYQVLATGAVGSPSFTPDSAQLAVVVDGDVLLYALDSDEFAPEQLTQRGDVLDVRAVLDKQADGPAFFVTAGERFYGCKVYRLDCASLKLSLLFDAGAETSALGAADCVSCSHTLFLQQPAPGGTAYERLMARDSETGAIAQATKPQQRADDYHESNFVFLDLHTVLFQRGGWGDWNLYTLDLGSGRELLEAVAAESPSASTDGRWLVFTARDYDAKQQAEYDWELPTAIKLRDREQRLEWTVSSPGAEAAFPAIAPDGGRVAWLERAGERTVVRMRSREGLAEPRAVEAPAG